jgi:predicted phosphodiesterase
LEQLAPIHLDWLKSLPPTATIANDVFLCHGDPSSDLTYLLEEVTANGVFLRSTEDITAAVANVSEPIILCGHSHVGRAIFLPTGKFIVNPGSVGLPAYTEDLPYPHKMESGSPHAKYAILSVAEDAWRVERVFVPYDWGKAARVALSNQRPDWAAWLATGRA